MVMVLTKDEKPAENKIPRSIIDTNDQPRKVASRHPGTVIMTKLNLSIGFS
jgi:hypothetical protein